MIHRKLLTVATFALGVSGCAQGVWVRPGTSGEEARMILSQCDYNATVDTRPSDIRVNSGYHRRNRQAHAIGDALAEGILAGIDEGIRKSDLMRKCMMAQGFYLQTGPTTATVTATVAGPRPQPLTNATPSGPAVTQISERIVVPIEQQPAASIVATPLPPSMGLPLRIASLPQSSTTMVGALSAVGVAGTPGAIETRSLMTTRMMRLPDQSPAKHNFLLGACSAGDATACVLSNLDNGRLELQ